MFKLIRTVYEYELDKSIEQELNKRGFWYTVKWDNHNPNGLSWTFNNKISGKRGPAKAPLVKREICDILKIDHKKVTSVNFDMGVMVTGEDDYGNEYYGQYLRSIILRSTEKIEDINIEE